MARPPVIVDHLGRPIERRTLTEEVAGASVTGVRSILSTHPTTGIAPERMASILREAETPGGASDYLELAEEMVERYLHYLGVLQTRRRAVAQIGVEILPASDSPADVAVADTVREFFDRPTLELELFDVLDSVGKGFSVSEIVWETSARQWMPARLIHRLPQWFDFDQDTGARLQRRGDGGGDWRDLEPYKFVTHVAPAKSGLPIRGGIARAAAWCWLFANYGLKDWVRYVESYGQPLRIGKYHAAATKEQIAVLKRAVRDIAADSSAVIPEEMVVEFVTDTVSGAGRSAVFADLQRYLDSQISVVVLGQTLTTEQGQSGSYALGQVHDRVRRDIERSDGRQLAATLRRDVAMPIARLNHGPDANCPHVRIEREDRADLDLVSRALERLVPLGLDVSADQVRALLGLPPPRDSDDVLKPPAPGVAAARLLAAARAADAEDAIDAATARALDGWRPMLDPLAGPAVDAAAAELERGGDLAALRSRLPALLADMDADDLASALERLAFSARLSGRAD